MKAAFTDLPSAKNTKSDEKTDPIKPKQICRTT
jgi:hypothetical protein